MIIFLFLKRFFYNFYLNISELYYLTRLQKKYTSCIFYSGAKISNSIFGNYNVVFDDVLIDSCTFGDHTYIQKKASLFNVDIGKYCSIASGVSIGPGLHNIEGISTHPVFYLKNTPLAKTYCENDLFISSKRTSIGHDVWIGEKAVILDGLTIGTGAIIAAGAVVTKNVPPYAIYGGVPAKLIRYRFAEDISYKLLNSCWWNNEENEIEEMHKLFNSVESFLDKI